MRILEFLVGLLVATGVHFAGERLVAGLSSYLDPFLLVVLFVGLTGRPASGLAGGLVAGWAADAATGGLFGLHGFADTLLGYATAVASQKLVIQRSSGVFLLFAGGAALQQLVLVALSLLLLPGGFVPGPLAPGVKLLLTGAVGAIGFLLAGRMKLWLGTWRRNRTAKLR